ncbi:MAG TPA: peptidylprolyl isomerase [Chloroflexi bacterium]|nr:peptidylprolyl isomerase [Chloroflexota bacterium]
MTKELLVADGVVVSLNYTLRLDSDEVVDSSGDQDPLMFLQGVGQIIPGLERELLGMAVGDEKSVSVAPADAYGELNPEAFESVSRDLFPADMELAEGVELHLQDPDGGIAAAIVAEIHPDSVLLDFNHPLAGETLNFDVKVADLRPATEEEIAHGHAHDPRGHGH